jgi:hypothetical protein
MKETARINLTILATEFASASDISLQAIGQRALKDNTFFVRLGAGSGFTVDTYDRLIRWFSKNWPDGVAWPSEIERLDAREAAE